LLNEVNFRGGVMREKAKFWGLIAKKMYIIIQHNIFFIIFAASNEFEDAFSNKNNHNSSTVIELSNL
jgi:hypothetical protein